MGLCVFFVIGHGDLFGFGLTIVGEKPLYTDHDELLDLCSFQMRQKLRSKMSRTP